jgi:hypothetical protein
VTNIGNQAFYYCTKLTGVYFGGNPPSLGQGIFAGDTSTTVYYLPDVTGWGAAFGGRPTALWRPSIQTDDASFGVRTNQFGFNIAWASGTTVIVEACANPANPIWTPLQTNILTSDLVYFSDPNWTNSPERFYRVRSP